MSIDRLSALDRMMLWASRRWPQDIGALAGLGHMLRRDMREMANDMGKFFSHSEKIVDNAIKTRIVDVNRVIEAKTYLDRALGRYSAHSTTDLRPDQVKAFVANGVAITRARYVKELADANMGEYEEDQPPAPAEGAVRPFRAEQAI